MLLIIASTTFLLITSVSGSTQVDVRLGSADFFLGEKFIITLNDVIYWFTGMCMGIIFAITYQIVSDFQEFQKRIDNFVENEDISNSAGGRRGARLIGPRKYPTRLEERMLSAIHSDPSNYFDEETNRGERLIESRRLPTKVEDQELQEINGGEDSSTENFTGRNKRRPRLIGPIKYQTQLEERFLRPVEDSISNSNVYY